MRAVVFMRMVCLNRRQRWCQSRGSVVWEEGTTLDNWRRGRDVGEAGWKGGTCGVTGRVCTFLSLSSFFTTWSAIIFILSMFLIINIIATLVHHPHSGDDHHYDVGEPGANSVTGRVCTGTAYTASLRHLWHPRHQRHHCCLFPCFCCFVIRAFLSFFLFLWKKMESLMSAHIIIISVTALPHRCHHHSASGQQE